MRRHVHSYAAALLPDERDTIIVRQHAVGE
jgi:hypothetical protein